MRLLTFTEGLPRNFSDRIDQVLARSTNYNIKVSGKTDWVTGGHTENVRLGAWMMNAAMPYDVNASGGWFDELPHFSCASNGTVRKGGGPKEGSAHGNDWKIADETTAWMRSVVAAQPEVPFFVYSGMSIVHPPYSTNAYWDAKIDRSKVEVPAWKPLMELHPCDFQSSMLKGCTPSDADSAAFYSADRRREVRAKYYAMIAEWDAMVGQYMQTVDDLGVTNLTVFIVTSDHGDMQMEKQQFYKMVPYDPSASVPMVISDGRPGQRLDHPKVVSEPTQLIDLMPTILDLAQVPSSAYPPKLDGFSLLHMTRRGGHETSKAVGRPHASRPDFIVSQFHGDDIAMSWFLVVKKYNESAVYKLIIWGTGSEVPSLLFNLATDPNEMSDLASAEGAERYADLIAELTANLRSVVDFPRIALDVAQYGVDSLRQWTQTTPNWQQKIHKGLRWDNPWQADPQGALEAVEALLTQPKPARILPCRRNLTWTSRTKSEVSIA